MVCVLGLWWYCLEVWHYILSGLIRFDLDYVVYSSAELLIGLFYVDCVCVVLILVIDVSWLIRCDRCLLVLSSCSSLCSVFVVMTLALVLNPFLCVMIYLYEFCSYSVLFVVTLSDCSYWVCLICLNPILSVVLSVSFSFASLCVTRE